MALVEQTPILKEQSALFVDDLRTHGPAPALLTADGVVTYAQLADRVDALASRLAAEGQRRLVLVAAANTVDAVVAYLGALRADQPALLAPVSNPVGTAALVDAYDPDVVLDGTTIGERRRTTAHVLHPDLALLLSTSGSTGSPKLVRLSRANLESNAAAIATYLGLTADDRAITTLPLHYCYGLSVLHSHLHVGASVVLNDRSVTDPAFWELFHDAGVTGLSGVPHTFALLDRVGFPAMELPSLRYLTQAGGRMAPATVQRYAELGARSGWDLFVMYGQTEATARMAYLPPALAATHPHAIGIPVPGGDLSIADPDDDGVGELVYRGPNVMLGYAETPADLAAGATVGALWTGDLARCTAGGLFEVVGRRSRFVKPFGLRIDLDRVEVRLDEHGIAARCAGDDDGVVVAVAPGAAAGAAALVSRELGLPPSHVAVVEVADQPVLANGKPDYPAILALGRAAPAPLPPPVAPGDSAAVRAVFETVLGVRPGDHDTFVSLGGDSLSYVEASIQLEAVLASLPRDWHTTPVGELAPARQPRRRRVVTSADTTVVLRAVSIVLIVATHVGLWQVPGGAHVLLAVAGFNFARFVLRGADRLRAIARIAVPSMAWIAAVAAVSDKYGWPNALLVHGFVERPGDRWGYWFVESLVQILVVLAAVLSVPALRRVEARWPFAVAAGAVAAGALIRFDVVELSSTFPTSRPHEVFWLFALGWAAARSDRAWHRAAVTAAAAAMLPGFFGNAHRELLILAGVAAVVWLPTVRVPLVLQRVVAPVAAASLWIYLTHYQVFPPVEGRYGPAAAVTVSVVVGIVAWWAASSAVSALVGATRAPQPAATAVPAPAQ